MKSIYQIILILAIGFSATAQTTNNQTVPNTQWGQMLEVGKTYTGTYRDTLTNTDTVLLSVCKGSNGSLTLNPVYTNIGNAEFRVLYTKISGNNNSAIRLESSYDGTVWGPEVYYNSFDDTLKIDSTMTFASKTFFVRNLIAPYYRIRANGRGTQASSVTAWYYIKREL